MNNYQIIMKKSSQNVLMVLGNVNTIMLSKKSDYKTLIML